MSRLVIDIESNNLMSPLLDYTSLPYKLKPEARLWCVVIRDIDNGDVLTASLDKCTKAWMQWALSDCTLLISHNGIKFDLPMLKLFGILDYTIGYPNQASTVFGKEVEMVDTLIWSRLFYADRYLGHSLGAWGDRLGEAKGDFTDFSQYSDEMLHYCVQDTKVTQRVYESLLEDWNNWDWTKSYAVELKLADLGIKRETFGFDFDREAAEGYIVDLDEKMETLRSNINPILPPKRLNQGETDFYSPPKIQFKKDGTLSAAIHKFAEKVSGEIKIFDTCKVLVVDGKSYPLPVTQCVKESLPADISDLDHVKSYLLSLGWTPIEWKERDLTKNAKKQMLSAEKRDEAIERYVKTTLNGVYREERLDVLGCTADTLESFLKSKIEGTKPIRVPTSPAVRIGVEKELCPNLLKLGEKAAFAKGFTEYLTYKHRRNSIAGGGYDEDGEPITGFMSMIREDGRVSTPAIELGAASGRYRHIGVCNIARVTSLYGKELRSLFRSGKGYAQLGFDFSSLEARVQGHYVLRYTDGEKLAASLVADKPFDLHSLNAAKLGISRNDAKSFGYAVMYGAQPAKLAKMLGVSLAKARRLYTAYWDAMPALKELKAALEKYWTSTGKKYIIGIDGRKLYARSQHSLINLLFQGSGSALAKWSTVLMMEGLEEQGYNIDPFISEPDIISMIEMHDECQIAIKNTMLKYQTFDTEQEAIDDASVNGGHHSAICHGKKWYYVKQCSISDTITNAIDKACEINKFKVPLGMEWAVASNWRDCH